MIAGSHKAGVARLTGVSVATQRSVRLLSCTSAFSPASIRRSTSMEMSRNWNRISARPGMIEGAPGSSAMRPVVHTERSPHRRGISRSTAASSRTAVRPASRRSAIVVPPA